MGEHIVKEVEQVGKKKWFHRLSQVIFYLFAIGFLIVILYSPQNQMKGKVAPLFETIDDRGERVSLIDLRGRVVLLDFWGRWCPHCVRMIPKLREIKKAYQKRGVSVIGIHSFDGLPNQRALKRYMEQADINYSVWRGKRDIERAYMIESWPTMFVIDRRGVVQDVLRGAQGKRKIEKILNDVLKE